PDRYPSGHRRPPGALRPSAYRQGAESGPLRLPVRHTLELPRSDHVRMDRPHRPPPRQHAGARQVGRTPDLGVQGRLRYLVDDRQPVNDARGRVRHGGKGRRRGAERYRLEQHPCRGHPTGNHRALAGDRRCLLCQPYARRTGRLVARKGLGPVRDLQPAGCMRQRTPQGTRPFRRGDRRRNGQDRIGPRPSLPFGADGYPEAYPRKAGACLKLHGMVRVMSALERVRVVDFSKFLPGPYCTWLLADMGADVIRIENPREIAKQAKVFGWDRLSEDERKALREVDILARNKRSVMLDIGDEKAQEAIKALVATADIVVEDYRPGVLEGIGLGYESLKAVKPDLIYVSLTLCGQTGPYRDKPGHDPIALAISGVLSRIGENPDAPSFPGVPAADVITGTHAAFATLAAFIHRQRTGEGQHIDVAMSDCAMSLLVNVLSRHPDPSTIPPRGTRRADTGLWRTKAGSFICTTDLEPRY